MFLIVFAVVVDVKIGIVGISGIVIGTVVIDSNVVVVDVVVVLKVGHVIVLGVVDLVVKIVNGGSVHLGAVVGLVIN